MLRVRGMTPEEGEEIKRLAHSRTQSARRVERANIIWLASQGERVPAIALKLGINEVTVRQWLKRSSAG